MALRDCLRHVYKLPNFSEELQETLILGLTGLGYLVDIFWVHLVIHRMSLISYVFP